MNASQFVEVLKRSKLIEDEKLPRIIKAIVSATDENRTPETMAEQLITGGHLTKWQAAQLLKGKHRGFIMGKYCFRKPLGRGGMGVVFEAEHIVLRTRVAVKVLPKERADVEKSVSRFLAEARAAAKLNHPNLLRVHDCDVVDGRRFMVMDLVVGANLGEIVERSGPLSYRNAIELLRQAAAGLDFAHENGVIHRDVKPHNFMVDNHGQLKVADLGLALFQIDSPDRYTHDGNNVAVLGTVDYVAPEQAWDSRKVDRRADIYSLGCTLYFMLTGKPPFGQGSMAQRLAKHQTSQPTPLQHYRADCPDIIAKLCAKMMAKKPEERFQRMREIVALCEKISPKLGSSGDLAGLATASQSSSGSHSSGSDPSMNTFGETEFEGFASTDSEPQSLADLGVFSSPEYLNQQIPQQPPSVPANYWSQVAVAEPPKRKMSKAGKEDLKKQILLYIGLGIACLSVGFTIWTALNTEEKKPSMSDIKMFESDGKTFIIDGRKQ